MAATTSHSVAQPQERNGQFCGAKYLTRKKMRERNGFFRHANVTLVRVLSANFLWPISGLLILSTFSKGRPPNRSGVSHALAFLLAKSSRPNEVQSCLEDANRQRIFDAFRPLSNLFRRCRLWLDGGYCKHFSAATTL